MKDALERLAEVATRSQLEPTAHSKRNVRIKGKGSRLDYYPTRDLTPGENSGLRAIGHRFGARIL